MPKPPRRPRNKKVKKEKPAKLSDSFAKQCLKNHNDAPDFDRMSISSGNSELDANYYKNQLSPIPKHVIISNCVRINNPITTQNVQQLQQQQSDINPLENDVFNDIEQKSTQNRTNLNGFNRNPSNVINKRSDNVNEQTILIQNGNIRNHSHKNVCSDNFKKDEKCNSDENYSRNPSIKLFKENQPEIKPNPITISNGTVKRTYEINEYEENRMKNSQRFSASSQVVPSFPTRIVESKKRESTNFKEITGSYSRNSQLQAPTQPEIKPNSSDLNETIKKIYEMNGYEENRTKNSQRFYDSSQVVPSIQTIQTRIVESKRCESNEFPSIPTQIVESKRHESTNFKEITGTYSRNNQLQAQTQPEIKPNLTDSNGAIKKTHETNGFEANRMRNSQRSCESRPFVPSTSTPPQTERFISNLTPIQRVSNPTTNSILPTLPTQTNELGYNRFSNEYSSTQSIVNNDEKNDLCCCCCNCVIL